MSLDNVCFCRVRKAGLTFALCFAIISCQHDGDTKIAETSCVDISPVTPGEIASYRYVLKGGAERTLDFTVSAETTNSWTIDVTENATSTQYTVSKSCSEALSTPINDDAIGLVLYGSSWGINLSDTDTSGGGNDAPPPRSATTLGCTLEETTVTAGVFNTNNCSFEINTNSTAGLATATEHKIPAGFDLPQPFQGLIYMSIDYEQGPASSVELISWNSM